MVPEAIHLHSELPITSGTIETGCRNSFKVDGPAQIGDPVRARMSSVKIMVSSHLVESVQQARKERFVLQDSEEMYNSFVFPDSLV